MNLTFIKNTFVAFLCVTLYWCVKRMLKTSDNIQTNLKNKFCVCVCVGAHVRARIYFITFEINVHVHTDGLFNGVQK